MGNASTIDAVALEECQDTFDWHSISWEAITSVNVREYKDATSEAIGLKDRGTEVYGCQEGDWLRLSDEPGYIRMIDPTDGMILLIAKVSTQNSDEQLRAKAARNDTYLELDPRSDEYPPAPCHAILWEVAHSVNVRKSKDANAEAIGFKNRGTEVYGFHEGDWLRLSGEPGYVRLVDPADGTMLLCQANVCPLWGFSNNPGDQVRIHSADEKDAQLALGAEDMESSLKSDDADSTATPCSADADEGVRAVFAGNVALALDSLPASAAQGGHELVQYSFTKASTLMTSRRLDLCDDLHFADADLGLTLDDLFQALYAKSSDFVARFQDRRKTKDVKWTPPQVVQGAPYGFTAGLTCTVPVPILGHRPYTELSRFTFSQEEESKSTLAVQTLGTIDAGWYGAIRSETIYLFSQEGPGGAVRMQAIGLSPTGAFAYMAIDGYKQALADFRKVSQQLLVELSTN
jgi:hypothetical protein